MVRNKKGNEATKATLGERQRSYKGNKAQKTARHSKQQDTVDSKAQSATRHRIQHNIQGYQGNKARKTTQQRHSLLGTRLSANRSASTSKHHEADHVPSSKHECFC
jgi:hypothetical protein